MIRKIECLSSAVAKSEAESLRDYNQVEDAKAVGKAIVIKFHDYTSYLDTDDSTEYEILVGINDIIASTLYLVSGFEVEPTKEDKELF